MTTDHIELARHMEWADALVWAAVLDSESARSDDRLRLLLYHVHVVQRVFVHLWREEPPHFPDPVEFPDHHAIARWGRDGHQQVQAFLTTATPDVLARRVQVPWAKEIEQAHGRQVVHPTIAQTATQLALHSAHHRGQINTRLREAGAAPPLIDFIAWVWWGQPEAAWPARVTSAVAT